MDLERRIALVASTWTPHQQLHPGNVAWHGIGGDGGPRPDLILTGASWFAEARMVAISDSKYRALKSVSIYRPELDLVVLAADGSPASFALGWLDDASASLLIEPVGTAPEHARRGLSAAVCAALLRTAVAFGAIQAVVGPRGDLAYPVPKRLYHSLGFTTIDRTRTYLWT